MRMPIRFVEFRAEKVLFWALLVLLVWLPIPLGSNRGWAWAVMEVWAFGLLACWLVLWAMDRVDHRGTPPEGVARVRACWARGSLHLGDLDPADAVGPGGVPVARSRRGPGR